MRHFSRCPPVLLSIFSGCAGELLKTESLTHDAIPPLIAERQYRWTHLNMRPRIKTTGDTTREDTAGGSITSGPSYRVPTLQHATRCPPRPVHPKSEEGDRHIHKTVFAGAAMAGITVPWRAEASCHRQLETGIRHGTIPMQTGPRHVLRCRSERPECSDPLAAAWTFHEPAQSAVATSCPVLCRLVRQHYRRYGQLHSTKT